jgi:gliding motility-associated-like protein
MVYKYNQAKILKTLSFFILICCLSCIELFGQSYVTWTGLNSSSIQGTFPGGTVTVSQSSSGNFIQIGTPALFTNNVFASGSQTFDTFGPNSNPPSNQLIFTFSTPVIVTRYNMSDIDQGSNWNDSFSFEGITFTSAVGINCNPTTTGVTTTGNFGNNLEYASWFTSTTPVTTFSINYAVTDGRTHAYLAYSLQVMLPSTLNIVTVNNPIICETGTATIVATNSIPGNYSYIWTVPNGVINPGNVASFSTSTAGIYSVEVTNTTTNETSLGSGTVSITPNVTPIFNQINEICENDILQDLPNISTNNISGSWSPPLNNTQTTIYTFTPDEGICANSTTMTIVVNPLLTPEFEQIEPICFGDKLAELPNISINNISGNWSPSINNTQTTTYTFEPDDSCAENATMTIVVNPILTPEFIQIDPICFGEDISDLPTTSLNNITGTWTPPINNTQTTTYTFTPDNIICTNNATITIVVNPLLEPEFSTFDPICTGETLNLPTLSENGISGIWSPNFNSSETTIYTFTPILGQCATAKSIEITVLEQFDFIINQFCLDGNYFLEIENIDEKLDLSTSNFYWTLNNVSISNNNSILNITNYINSTSIIEELPFEVSVKVIDFNNCEKINNFSIESVFCSIQKGISPNNDGLNDFFDLRLLNVKKLSIFNRYGLNVYEKNNYLKEWYGQTSNGDILPDGVYYYVIEFNSDNSNKTGWIYLNK